MQLIYLPIHFIGGLRSNNNTNGTLHGLAHNIRESDGVFPASFIIALIGHDFHSAARTNGHFITDLEILETLGHKAIYISAPCLGNCGYLGLVGIPHVQVAYTQDGDKVIFVTLIPLGSSGKGIDDGILGISWFEFGNDSNLAIASEGDRSRGEVFKFYHFVSPLVTANIASIRILSSGLS